VGMSPFPSDQAEMGGDSGRGLCAIIGGASSSLVGSGDSTLLDNWSSIEEAIQAGKGARRRLTMIPQKFSEWCIDDSGYHPMTREG
jgi:hypothetical protein